MATAKKAPAKKAVAKKAPAKKAVAKKAPAKRSVSKKDRNDSFELVLSGRPERAHKEAETLEGRVLPKSFASQLGGATEAKQSQSREKKASRSSGNPKLLLVVLLTAAISIAGTYFISKPSDPVVTAQTSFEAKISGGVVLTEIELKAAVKELGETVFWAGAMKDAKYTLNASNRDQIYVRYLPNGKGVSDTNPDYRVIATYKQVNAFAATVAAGNQSNGVTFSSTDGAMIYYNKVSPNNIYLAYKSSDFQIEVFDPDQNTAVQLATTSHTIVPIL
jgi:hypothetical protein